MHKGMGNVQALIEEATRHAETKRDFIADTKENMAMVRMEPEGDRFKDGVAIVLSNATHEGAPATMERFEISENCHKQIASRLGIPVRYYHRMLDDHTDLLLQNVNEWFRKEPHVRMLRTLDGRARAFLSDRYRRVDNLEVLAATLPVINENHDVALLGANVDEDRMRLKMLFRGDDFAVDLGTTPDGKPDIVHAGFEMGNHETGGGSMYIRGFFYRGFCWNGCVFGTDETMAFKQVHIGSRLGITDDLVLSDDTKRKEDELIISASRDVLANLASPKFTQALGDRLRALKQTRVVKDPHAAVEAVCKEVGMSEHESKSVLQSFLRDNDLTQWGMVNAITEQANPETTRGEKRDVDFEHASRIEELGAKIINLPANRWNSIANLEAVAA